MTYSSKKQREVRLNRKQNIEIVRILIDLIEENPDMSFASMLHALNLHKIAPGQENEEVLLLMKKWTHTLKLLRSIHD